MNATFLRPRGCRRLPCTAALLLAAAACTDAPLLQDAVVVTDHDAHRPTVALDPTGAGAYVAWVAGDSTFDVLLARLAADGGVTAPVRVNDVAGDAAPHAQAPAQVAVAPDGTVYVAWQNNTPVAGRRFPASDLRLAVSTDGGRTFLPAIYVNDDADGPPTSHTFHDLAVADDGTVYVSWIDGRAGAEGPQIRVARSTDRGRSFEPSVVVASPACPCCRTALAVHGTTVYLAWRDVSQQSIRDVVVARSRDRAATWSTPTVVHADGWRIDGCPHAGPDLAVTADGRLHVAWYTGAPASPGIHYAWADSTLAFSEPQALLTGEWVPPSLVALAAQGERAIAAWDDRRTDAPALYVGTAQSGDAARTTGLAPALDAGPTARAVAWLRGDSVFTAYEAVR